jgi:hypothetical protein
MRAMEMTRARRRLPGWSGLAVALLALLVTYGIFLVRPWPHSPLDQFLAMYGRNNSAAWRIADRVQDRAATRPAQASGRLPGGTRRRAHDRLPRPIRRRRGVHACTLRVRCRPIRLLFGAGQPSAGR